MFTITSTEENIFSLLRKVALEYNVTVRVAGGWVRDKLLGLESDDIDVCVDTMSGESFALLVAAALANGKKVAKVSANTEANKNLESAILRIHGVEVDFAQLRKETYDEESRNPEVEVGVTPLEDAQRRDLTINAIFYNLMTQEVEDWVGGARDLQMKIARTPIDPLRTYLEDPLRILRAVRFIARFDLQVDPALAKATCDERVQEALVKKISRERIWTELSKILSGPNVPYAMEVIHWFGLRNLLLVPTDEQLKRANQVSDLWTQGFCSWDMEQNNPHHSYNVWQHTLAAMRWANENLSKEDTLIRNLALLLHDVGKCDVCSQQVGKDKTTYHGHERSGAVLADEILQDLRAPNDIRNRVVKLVRQHMRLHLLPKGAHVGLRRVYRDVGPEDWKNLVDMSQADSMGKVDAELDSKYVEFDQYIQEYSQKLNGKAEVKPPLDGNEVMELLGLQPGRQVGIVMAAFKEELLQCPDMTPEEAKTFLLETFSRD